MNQYGTLTIYAMVVVGVDKDGRANERATVAKRHHMVSHEEAKTHAAKHRDAVREAGHADSLYEYIWQPESVRVL